MQKIQEIHFDIKKITGANWQWEDTTTNLWRSMTSAASTPREWMDFFLSPQVNQTVPVELAKMLEVARGTMIYSWYFYPLATLGAEQCFRILDTAAIVRIKNAGLRTKRKQTFNDNIIAMARHGLITQVNEKRWHAIRDLRNDSSHPAFQTILDPGQAQSLLSVAAELLNNLFG